MAEKKEKQYVSDNARLMAEWDWEKNNELGFDPKTLTCGSGKRVWWKCSECHNWQASIANRSYHESGCPYCGGKKALAGFNDLATTTPTLAAEWHPVLNGKLTPEMVVAGSDKSVWWRCKNGHEWKAAIKDRQHGNGCPYCSGRLAIPGETDLATLAPWIAAQWHPTKNGKMTPADVTVSSNKKVWWICEKGHEWETSVDQRKKAGCPYCGNKKVLKGYNDLATTHPELVTQWHPTKNGAFTASMVSYGSTKLVWWQCDKGHEWRDSPNGRTNKEEQKLLNCPICSSELRTSFAEQAIFYYLKLYTEAHNRQQVYGKELDIWLPQLNVGIEHDGMYYHQNEARDNAKKSFFENHGVQIITVRESKANRKNGFVIEYDYRDSRMLSKAIDTLLDLLEIKTKMPINVDADAIAIQNQYIQMTKESSLAARYPELAEEWHPTKNGTLLPDQFSCGSHKKVWWRGKCGHEWVGTIKQRTATGSGCPVCDGKIVQKGFNDLATFNPKIASMWHPAKNGNLTPDQVTPFSNKKAWWRCEKGHEWYATISGLSGGASCPICSNHKIMGGVNDLATTHPELAAEWHPTKNGALTPQEISYGNDKKVWWICSKGHEWETSPNSRTNAKTGCPYCSNKKVLTGYNDLATTNPELAKQWHPTKNGELCPRQIISGSSLKAWWLCDTCGYEWEALISKRNKRSDCPKCGKKKK